MAQFNMPITNQKVADQAATNAEAKRRMNVQKLAKSPAPVTPSAVQQLGAKASQQVAQGQTQALQQGAQQTVQDAQVQNQQAQMQQQQKNMAAKEAQQNKQLGRKDILNKLDASMSQELLDETMNLRDQKANQVFNNERQMMDWMATKAKDANELQAWQQQAQQIQAEQMNMLDDAHAMAKQALQFEYERSDNKRKREIQDQLDAINRAHKKAQEDAKKKANKSGGLFKAAVGVAKIAGGAALATWGGPAGAAAGGSMMASGAGDTVGGASQAGII